MEHALSLFRRPCEFMAGAATIESLPPVTHPEIAIIGRSNVGKSSLVNALIGQKALARTSQNPGHTQQLNFFLLGEKLMLVDMPGYGFARVSKQQKGEWDHLIRSYLAGRTSLKRACVLIDCRRGIMKHDDDFMKVLDDSAVNYQIVLTKCDTLGKGELETLLAATREGLKKHVAAHPEIIATSAADKTGIDKLQEQLAPFAI